MDVQKDFADLCSLLTVRMVESPIAKCRYAGQER